MRSQTALSAFIGSSRIGGLGVAAAVCLALSAGASSSIATCKATATLSFDAIPLAADDLSKYVGEYVLPNQSVIVALKDPKTLTAKLPGQPEYRLEAIDGKPGEFKLAYPGLEGFSLVFVEVNGEVTEAVFHQPNGVFPAVKKKAAELGENNADVVAGLREMIETVRKDWQVQGLAVGIIRDGEVLLLDGFGVRDVDSAQPVTAHTQFAIGSASKAFTTAVLATLVDEGKLEWDKPVRTWWPDFAMSDEIIASRVTLRDMVTHRTGLPRHDLAWYGSTASRAELLARVRHLATNADLRESWQYNNFMIVASAHVGERITGQSWEDLVRSRIFGPAGMNESDFSVTRMTSAGDCATGYKLKDEKVVSTPYRNIDAMGPAGSINSSATDMLKWVRVHLGEGELDGTRVFSAAQIAEMHTPQMVVPVGGNPLGDAEYTMHMSYGLGWFTSVYRGHALVEHGGNIDGFSALVSMLPKDKIGIVVLTNMDATAATEVIAKTAIDRLLKLPAVEWNSKYRSLMKLAKESAKEQRTKGDSSRVEGTSPSHPLADFAGEYEHPGYGVINVGVEGDSLKLSINGITAPFKHFHYDIFRGSEGDGEGLKVRFETGMRGDIESVSLAIEPTGAPIVFKRRADAALAAGDVLSKYVGDYSLSGVVVVVAMRGEKLTVTVPGQPAYELLPIKSHEFELQIGKGVTGYSMKFTLENDRVTEATFIQPNGSFVAKRVEK